MLSQHVRIHHRRNNQRLPQLPPRDRISLSHEEAGAASAYKTPASLSTTHHVPLHDTKCPRIILRPAKRLEFDPPLEHDPALVVPAHPQAVDRPRPRGRTRDDGGILVFDPERVEAFFNEVDEDAWSDRGVETGELRGVASTVLSLGLGYFREMRRLTIGKWGRGDLRIGGGIA